MNKLIPILIIGFIFLNSDTAQPNNPELLTYNSRSSENEDLTTRIDTYLTQSSKNGFSGSVLVAVKGQIILSKGYGWSDRAKKIPNAPNSVYNIGSITKQFTAAGILKLTEQEKLNTSDKIEHFFPEAPGDKKGITVHQLLTHTSGISPATGGFRYDEASKEQFLKEFFASELISEPGSSYQYANANYIMLTVILEAVSGQDYESFLMENFWAPSELNATGYKNFTFQSDGLAHGYYYHYSTDQWKDWGTTFDHLPQTENHWYSIGKGDIYSTTEDLYKWHQALEKNDVLTQQSRTLMESPLVPENESGSSHYGYGWAIFESETGGKIVTHNGSNGIYFADLIRFKEKDVVIIVLSNAIPGYRSQNIAWEISRMIPNPDYRPSPIQKNIYELIYDFMGSYDPEQASQLPEFLEKHMATKSLDRTILNRLGLALLEKEDQPDWGLEWLQLNVELFPEDGNLWDSLGEAYFRYNQKEKALHSFKQALIYGEVAENCYWCNNSQKKVDLIIDYNSSPLSLLSHEVPGDSAIVFAKDIISTDAFEFAITFSPEMDELFFTRRKPDSDNQIYTSKLINEIWTTPQLAFFTPDEGWDFEPHINPAGDKLYFGSVRPHPDTLYPGGLYQWVSERTSEGWSQPIPLEAPFDNRFVMYLTSSATGNLYFTSMEEDAKMEDGGIYYSKAEGENYKEVSRMGNAINFQGKWIAHPYIAPDESYIIYDGEVESGYGENDLFISFNIDGNWSEAYNMGPEVNTTQTEMCASVSPDGKYLFFHRGDDDSGDIYWIDFVSLKERILRNNNGN